MEIWKPSVEIGQDNVWPNFLIFTYLIHLKLKIIFLFALNFGIVYLFEFLI
jgi:hypothetical protein